MKKKTENKDKDPHSDIPGGHALFRLRQMQQERGIPASDEDARKPKTEDSEKKDQQP